MIGAFPLICEESSVFDPSYVTSVRSRPSRLTDYVLEHDPVWDPIRDDPRFRALLEWLGYSVDRVPADRPRARSRGRAP